MIWAGPRLGLVDVPDARRIHTEEKSRAGGIAVWCTVLLVFAGILSFVPSTNGGSLNWRWFQAFLIASGFLLAVGIIDDRRGLSAFVKLAAQIGVAVFLFYAKGSGMGKLLGLEVPSWLDLVCWVVWTVGLINAFNLIDGMDGLCAGLATISVGALAVISFIMGKSVDGLVMLGMVGALLGFLRYNFHPARIFLGDAGSMFVGLFIASAATTSAGERAVVVSLLVPLLVAGVPLFDVLLAVWRRAGRSVLAELGVGKAARVFGADREHLHHRLLNLGLTQRKAAGMLYAIALAGACFALLPAVFDERALGITIAAFLIAGMMGIRYLAPVELRTSGQILNMALKRPPAGRLIALGYFVFDVLAILAAVVLALTLEASGLDWFKLENNLPALFAVTLACGLIGLRLGKAHTRHWGRASIRDYWSMGIYFAIAMLVAFSLMTIVHRDLAWSLGRLYLLTGVFAMGACLIPRSLTPFVREAVIDANHRRIGRSRGVRKRLVLYGAGDLGELFVSHLKTTSPQQFEEMRILGFIDDHPNLRGRVLDGFPIFGAVESLAELKKKYDLHGVLITTTFIDPDSADQLNRLADEFDLRLYRWRPHLQFSEIGLVDLAEEEEFALLQSAALQG